MMVFISHAMLIFGYTLFALYDIIVREVMEKSQAKPIPLPLLLLIREVSTALILLPFALGTEGPRELSRCFWPRDATTGSFSARRFGLLFLSGMLGILLSQLLYGTSIVFAGPTSAAVVESLVPMFVTVAGLLFGLEKTRSRCHALQKLGGVALAVTGAIFIIAGSGHHRHHHNTPTPLPVTHMTKPDHASTAAQVGISVGLINNIFLSAYFFLLQDAAKDHAPLSLTIFQCTVSAVIMAAIAAHAVQTSQFELAEIFRSGLGRTLAGVVGITATYNLAMVWASRYLPSSAVAVYQCLHPVATAVASSVLLKVPLTFFDLLGTAVIFGGFRLTLDFPDKSAEASGGGGGGAGVRKSSFADELELAADGTGGTGGFGGSAGLGAGRHSRSGDYDEFDDPRYAPARGDLSSRQGLLNNRAAPTSSV
eukprot:g329.t1